MVSLFVILDSSGYVMSLFTLDGMTVGGYATVAYFILFSNSAHFASSTLRMYTMEGHAETWPFLTMAFPLVVLAVLTFGMLVPGDVGPPLQALYLTWSPYHYAAQSYGLAVMYCYRSGCLLNAEDKRLLYIVAMVPFAFSFLVQTGGGRTGLPWLLPFDLMAQPWWQFALTVIEPTLTVAVFVLPLLLMWRLARSSTGAMPLISLLIVLSNAVWWFVLAPINAFLLATVFHGIQYLSVVIVFHVRDQRARPDNTHGALWHAVTFYGACFALGYGLFHVAPQAFVLLGFGVVESFLLCGASINIHHFIVDAFIWKLGKGSSNRRIVDAGAPA
ncbi:MAG: hypothetical protein ACPGU1_19095 [Myxococcota bacterium]